MSDDINFKTARKTRTEKNKLVESINQRRLDITGELKKYGDEIIGKVENIYDVVVLPFESEDKKRKAAAAKAATERAEKLAKESIEIAKISAFFDSAIGKPSGEISDLIEAVDLIEVDVFDKELIHEAIEIKKTTLEKLDALLSDTKTREILEVEREELAKKTAEADKKAAIVDRINTLKMIPTKMFGKTPAELREKIGKLKNFELTEKEFGEKTNEAKESVVTVISQLDTMLVQQIKVDKASLSDCDPEPEYEENNDHQVDLEKQDDSLIREQVNDVALECAKASAAVRKPAKDETAETPLNPFHDWFTSVGVDQVKQTGETGEDFKYRLCQMAYQAGVTNGK
jgi:hypothetical protein